MREKIFIFGAVGLMIALLVGLNAMSYTQKEEIPDSEAYPNRSSYNTGPTGIRAFYDLLVSTGRTVRRWEEPMIELNNYSRKEVVTTFVIVGKTRKEMSQDEIEQIMEWVEYGGRLVVVDRAPPEDLLRSGGGWKISTTKGSEDLTNEQLELLKPTVDPSNSKQMTDGENAAKPFQPTHLTIGVNAIQPSKFASSILLARETIDVPNVVITKPALGAPLPPPAPAPTGSPAFVLEDNDESEESQTDLPREMGSNVEPANSGSESESIAPGSTSDVNNSAEEIFENGAGDSLLADNDDVNTESNEDDGFGFSGPLIHFGNPAKNIVAEYLYGEGQVIFVSDPYIFSNGGVGLVDNAQLGLNIFTEDGVIAFDEYHQGFGSGQNRLLGYFSATPLVPVLIQLFLIALVIMYSRSRRFARPLPLNEPNRISKLEYVAAMAQLKKRTKAFDLAVENIYTDFRRRVARQTGIDNSSGHNRQIAEAIASRTSYTASEIETLMSECEDIIHGQATHKKEVLSLTKKLREVENALGLIRGRTTFRK